MVRVLWYFIVNGSFLSSLIYGIFFEVQWAENVAVFIVVVLTIFALLAMFNMVVVAESLNKNKPLIPERFDVAFDVICTLIMAAAGWFCLAGCYVFHMVVLATVRSKAKKL